MVFTMSQIIIKVGSVTYAMKGKSVLQSYGIRAQVVKTPKPQKNEGCGYSLIVRNPPMNVPELLRRGGIDILDAKWEK